jgi:hypothetical protein
LPSHAISDRCANAECLGRPSRRGRPATLQRIEQSEGVVKENFATVLKIQNALEQAGIHFTDDAKSASVCK